ncbi:hypothetical protein ASF47_18830 [Nocardioides sp. Leaf285]|nr:hypothetical protein ASF47_18830 [Nocardioides sp. Leaf285]
MRVLSPGASILVGLGAVLQPREGTPAQAAWVAATLGGLPRSTREHFTVTANAEGPALLAQCEHGEATVLQCALPGMRVGRRSPRCTTSWVAFDSVEDWAQALRSRTAYDTVLRSAGMADFEHGWRCLDRAAGRQVT